MSEGQHIRHLCRHGDDWYSYSTCIRTRDPVTGFTVGNVTQYSTTTSRHQNAAGVRACDVQVDNAPMGVQAEDLWALARP